jgi:cation transport ATPase
MKKQLFYSSILVLFVIIGFNSCTIEKRSYQPGYYVDWHNLNRKSKTNPENLPEQGQKTVYDEMIVVETTNDKIDEFNQPITNQEIEPFYASNDENANRLEITNTTKQKSTSTYNTQKVDIKINKSGITKKTISSDKANNESKKLHWKAIIGFVFSILSWAIILSFFFLFNFNAVMLMFLIFGISLISGIAGVYFSDIAIDDISKYPEKYRGEILAKAGLGIGLVLVSIFMLYIIIVWGIVVLQIFKIF